MLTISTENTGTFELPPAGAVAARCCRLIDLGSQESTFEGKTSLKRKVLLTWELAELRSDGSPFTISRRFGLSLHENAALRAFLQAWRGRPFTDDELAGFDLRKLISAPCLLNIAHTSRNGKDYSNILSISPLPKGMEAPALAGPAVLFDIDEPGAPDVLAELSEGLQATITASPEWKARIAALDEAARGDTASAPAGFDDDIPF